MTICCVFRDNISKKLGELVFFGRSETVVLGGTAERGNWDDTTDEDTTDRIMNGCCHLMPSLKVNYSRSFKVGQSGTEWRKGLKRN